MTLTPVSLLQKAKDYELRLSFEPPNTLTVEPARRCPQEFADVLRTHKPALLALLRLPFRTEYSEILKQTLFFARDENTRAALVEAGDDAWSIYTLDELRILVAQNRAKPFLPDELCKLHEIKGAFHGRISS